MFRKNGVLLYIPSNFILFFYVHNFIYILIDRPVTRINGGAQEER
jgi:hypothetical protein